MSFFAELKRRNVFRVGIAYVVVAWLLAQIADLGLENFGSPDWVIKTILFVLALGFPLALFFAWAFEMTPEGIKKEKEVDRTQSITHKTGRKLDYTIIGLLAIGLVYFAWESRFQSDDADIETSPVAQEIAEEKVEAAPEPVEEDRSIAVLPFANRSRLEDDEFFTEGIHDDLLTHLAKIGSLKVISRTSVMRYKDTEKSIPEIAKELQVATILEGGIQRSGSQVRINVQLIDAKTDEHLWAEIFDRQLTAENLFAIQSEIATEIAAALEATLSPEEQTRLADIPTTNMAAYNAYLRGRQLQTRRTSTDLEQALAEFTRATELDPQYAIAWVGVAESANLLSGYGTLSLTDSLEMQENATSKALEINSELGEAYASLANLYSFRHENEEAETAYKKAIELSPNYASAYHWYSGLLAGFVERLDESIAMLEKAAELDPMSSIIQSGLAHRQERMGRYDEAEEQYLKVIELDPDFAANYWNLSELYVQLGRFSKAIETLKIARNKDPGNIFMLMSEGMIYLDLGDYDAIEALSEEMREIDSEHFSLGAIDMMTSISKGNYAGALETAQWIAPKVANAPGFVFFLSITYLLNEDWDKARELILKASPGFADSTQWAGLISNSMGNACTMAQVYLKTGDADKAKQLIDDVNAHHESVKSLIEHADRIAPVGCWLVQGKFDEALDALAIMVAHKHYSFWWLDLKLPAWDQVRAEPRFQAAMQTIEAEVAEQRRQLAELKLETDA